MAERARPWSRRGKGTRTARIASGLVRDVVERAGWIYRPQEDQDDVGVDAEIEVVDDLEVTGWLLKAQVRGHQRIRWRGDTFRMLVKRSTYNEWLTIGLPVAVILGDVSTSELFWSIPYGAPESTDPGAKVPITLDRSRRLQADLSGLRRVIGSWRAGYVADPLSEIGPFLRIFRELEAGQAATSFFASTTSSTRSCACSSDT